MKKYVPLIALALTLSLSTSAFAMEVPTDTVVQNLNGSQQVIKTYTIDPGADPQELIEESFVLDGYLYTFADIVKEDNHVEDVKSHTETVTVETSKDDLDVILEQLAPVIEYDDGLYSGTLSLDHTSLHTEATGYSTRSYTVSETKTISQLDRNDMSYVPATTVKDGVTLNLAGVDWQVTGTDLVGEVLSPSSWQAVATYSGKAYYSAADGYITTAEYVGDITRAGVESITQSCKQVPLSTVMVGMGGNGVECGILAGKLPGLDAVSIGPDLPEIHTREVFEAAATAYEQSGPGQLRKGYRAMRRDSWLFSLTCGRRRGDWVNWLLRQIPPCRRLDGIVLGRTPAPGSDESSRQILRRAEGLAPAAARQLLLFLETAAAGGELPGWFDRNFNGTPCLS